MPVHAEGHEHDTLSPGGFPGAFFLRFLAPGPLEPLLLGICTLKRFFCVFHTHHPVRQDLSMPAERLTKQGLSRPVLAYHAHMVTEAQHVIFLPSSKSSESFNAFV